MYDIFFVSKCPHKIQNYTLTLYKHNDTYRAKLPCEVIPNKALTYIRAWDAEQKYIREHNSNNIQSKLVSTKNIVGANAQIGIHDYDFVSPTEIEFHPGAINMEDLVPPVILIDFTANPKDCPRCTGTSVIKDITIDNKGRAVLVTGVNKIKQRILKALMTPLGTSPFDETYGTELYSLVGTTIKEDTRIIIQKQIVDCVNYLITNQSANLTDEERIASMSGLSLDVIPSQNGAGTYTLLIHVKVKNAVGTEIDCAINFDLG